MMNPPEEIWLRDYTGDWWQSQKHDSDVRYIRADVADEQLARAEVAIRRLPHWYEGFSVHRICNFRAGNVCVTTCTSDNCVWTEYSLNRSK